MSQDRILSPGVIADSTPPKLVITGRGIIHTIEVYPDGWGWKDTITNLEEDRVHRKGCLEWKNQLEIQR